jgi:amino acid transporter
MKKFTNFLLFIFILAILIVPVLPSVQAAPLVPCGITDQEVLDKNQGKGYEQPCDFTDFLTLINNVINFTIKFLAIPIAAIMFVYAGFLLVTAGGGEAKTKAKTIFSNAVLGLVIAAGAWVIVRTLLQVAGYKYTSMFF